MNSSSTCCNFFSLFPEVQAAYPLHLSNRVVEYVCARPLLFSARLCLAFLLSPSRFRWKGRSKLYSQLSTSHAIIMATASIAASCPVDLLRCFGQYGLVFSGICHLPSPLAFPPSFPQLFSSHQESTQYHYQPSHTPQSYSMPPSVFSISSHS